MPTAITTNSDSARGPRNWAKAAAGAPRRRGFWRDKSGGVAIMYAIVLPGLLGLVGLGVETGYWYVGKRDLQTQADAAALTAAYEKAATRDAEMKPAAINEAVRNGFPNSAATTLTLHNPPTTGKQAGNDKAVEAVLTQNYAPMFSALFHPGNITIRARAVATLIASGEACVLALNATADGAVSNSGNTNVNSPTCTVAANSTASDAIKFGGSSTLDFDSLWTAGGTAYGGSTNVTLNRPEQTHMWAITDPYASLTSNAPSGCNINNQYNGLSKDTSIPNSGSYSPGTTICGNIHITGGIIDFKPGTYWLKGGSLQIDGGTVKCSACTPGGDGVTFIFTTDQNGKPTSIGTVSINGGATVTLNAPNTGPYKGVLFYQDRRAPQDTSNMKATLNGGSGTALNGAIYFPNNEVAWSGNTNLQSACTLIVGDKVTFTGASNLSVDDCTKQGVNISFIQKISLVE